MIQIGDKIPSIDLIENIKEKVNLAKLSQGKKIVVFGVPGAFTPGCSKTHLPGYLQDLEKYKSKGVSDVVCISVNDPFVMDAWSQHSNAAGKIRMLADPQAEFVKSLKLDFIAPALGGIRCKRFSMLLQDGIVKFFNVEQDNTGTTCTLSGGILKEI
eukprot:Sdes_comp17209_c0_seq1m6392